MKEVYYMTIKKIGIIGVGTMGHGIAQVAAQSGFEVWIRDIDDPKTNAAIGKIEKNWERLIEKGKFTADQKKSARQNLKSCRGYQDFATVDLLIEAITENTDQKRSLFREVNGLVKKEAFFATNTSSISVTQLATASGRPDRFVGMHFFNPVPLMALVEIIRGLQTSDETYAAAFETAKAMGKSPAAVKDAPGFAVNRLLLPMINEAFYLLQEGVADAKTIDEVMKLGANHPMGPLTLADFVGLDVTLAALEVLHRDFGDSKYRPCPLLRKYVESGWYGKKTGRGVYSYT